jgi:hypothetical protein
MASMTRKEHAVLADKFDKSRGAVPPELCSNPQVMILANRILQEDNPRIYRELAGAKSPEDVRNIMIKYHLISTTGSDEIGNLFSNDSPPDALARNVASIISGEMQPSRLEKLSRNVAAESGAKIKEDYLARLRETLKTDRNFNKNTSSMSRSKILNAAGAGMGIFGAIAAAYLLFNLIAPTSFENKRAEAMRPVYSEYLASQPVKAPPTIDDFITIGLNEPFRAATYTAMPSNPDAATLYTAAIGLPESGGQFGNEISKELLDQKIAALDSIIADYPTSLEAYMSQYQIYILKSFNQNFYSSEEIIGEIDLLITQYPNIQELSTKKLVELIDDYLAIQTRSLPEDQASKATIDWIRQMIGETGTDTYAYFKLNYILASIYAGQQELIPVSNEDKLTIISLPSSLLQNSGGASVDEIIRLYLESANGDSIRASIGQYSAGIYLLKGANLDSETATIPTDRLIDAANHLEESIVRSESYPEYERYWVADAMYKLAQVTRQLGQLQYAQDMVSKIGTEFPNDPLVTSGANSKLYDSIGNQIQSIADAKTNQAEQNFETWLKAQEQQANPGK